ncbi:MAG TPA: hypothetical protein VF488_10315 [Gemmatimonadaceae bacterium]
MAGYLRDVSADMGMPGMFFMRAPFAFIPDVSPPGISIPGVPFMSPILLMSDVFICPIMLFITSARLDSESRRNCAEVTTRCPGSSPERI